MKTRFRSPARSGLRTAEVAEPRLELVLVGVGREAAHRSNAAADRELLAVDPRGLAAFLKVPAERPLALVADEQQRAFRVGKEVLEVVHDPAAGQHPRGGDDHERPVGEADRLRLLDRIGELLARVHQRRLARAQELSGLLVVGLGVRVVDLRGPRGHRRVEEERQARDASGTDERVEDPDHLLGAADGEGRHQQNALVAGHLADGGHQLVDRRFVRPVLAIAVRRLDDHVVGVGERGRVADDRRVAAADVAREDQGLGCAAIGHAQLDDRRAEDVARVVEDGGDVVGDGHLGAVVAADRQRHRLVDVVVGVQRLADLGASLGRGVAQTLGEGLVVLLDVGRNRLGLDLGRGLLGLGGVVAVPALGELDLELRRVAQDDLREVDRRACRVDRPGVSGPGEGGNSAAVIEVGVGQQERVDRLRVEREGHPVASRLLRRALEHPAVDEHVALADRQEELRAGHAAGGAEELDADRHVGRVSQEPDRGCVSSGRMSLPFDPPLEPMLAKPTPEIPTGDGWTYEPKWDGFRALVFRDGSIGLPPVARSQAAEPLLPGARRAAARARWPRRPLRRRWRGRDRATRGRARLRFAAHSDSPRRVPGANAGRRNAGIVRRLRLPGRW